MWHVFVVLKKNFLLQTRSRRSFLGIAGWGPLILQVIYRDPDLEDIPIE
jgi:hypothetical protein